MPTYRAILDGSGTMGEHNAAVYAGIVGTNAQIVAFVEEWNTLLQRHNLRYLKLAQALGFYGEFQSKAESGAIKETLGGMPY